MVNASLKSTINIAALISIAVERPAFFVNPKSSCLMSIPIFVDEVEGSLQQASCPKTQVRRKSSNNKVVSSGSKSWYQLTVKVVQQQQIFIKFKHSRSANVNSCRATCSFLNQNSSYLSLIFDNNKVEASLEQASVIWPGSTKVV